MWNIKIETTMFEPNHVSFLPSGTVAAERLCFYRCLSVHGVGRCNLPWADTPPCKHIPPVWLFVIWHIFGNFRGILGPFPSLDSLSWRSLVTLWQNHCFHKLHPAIALDVHCLNLKSLLFWRRLRNMWGNLSHKIYNRVYNRVYDVRDSLIGFLITCKFIHVLVGLHIPGLTLSLLVQLISRNEVKVWQGFTVFHGHLNFLKLHLCIETYFN